MSTTLGGYPCLDPAAEYAAALALGQPTAPWAALANGFDCPLGPGPGRGVVLMLWRDLAALDREASHDLVIAGGGTGVTLRNLVFGPAHAAVCGARDDGQTSFAVEIFDRRALAMAGPPLNASYNVLDADGTAYLTASLSGGVTAWTWATMLGDIWAANGLMGAFPGLPFSPDGTPEGFTFWGVPSYDAINQALDRIGCALKLDPLADAYSIVRIATEDAATSAALERADPVRLRDDYPVEPARPRVPEKVRVFFPVIRAGGDGTGAAPYYTLDRTDASPLAGVQAGTVAAVFDDLSAVYDATPTLTNAAALGARADERASDYFRRLKEERLARRYSGAMRGMLPGKSLKGVSWRDGGSYPGADGGVTTGVRRHPGYGGGPATPGGGGVVTGDAETSPFPADGAGGRDGKDGRDGGGGLIALLLRLWPLLVPMIRSLIRLLYAAGTVIIQATLEVCGWMYWCSASDTLASTVHGYSYPHFGEDRGRVVLRLTPASGGSVVTGMLAPPTTGLVLFLMNISTADDLILWHQNAGSSAANRFILPSAASLYIEPGGCVGVWYDGTSSRWRVLTVECGGETGTHDYVSSVTCVDGVLDVVTKTAQTVNGRITDSDV